MCNRNPDCVEKITTDAPRVSAQLMHLLSGSTRPLMAGFGTFLSLAATMKSLIFQQWPHIKGFRGSKIKTLCPNVSADEDQTIRLLVDIARDLNISGLYIVRIVL